MQRAPQATSRIHQRPRMEKSNPPRHYGVFSPVDQELNLVKVFRTLAEQGHSFLVVETPDDGQADRLTELAASLGAVSAQRFGRFIVEDLDVGAPELAQSFESPDRELDIDPAQGTMR